MIGNKEYWINDNGVSRLMTPQEIEDMEREAANIPPHEPTETELLRAEVNDLTCALADIYGGGV